MNAQRDGTRDGDYAYSGRLVRVAFGSGVLLLPPAEESVDLVPAHVRARSAGLCHCPCRCEWFDRQAPESREAGISD